MSDYGPRTDVIRLAGSGLVLAIFRSQLPEDDCGGEPIQAAVQFAYDRQGLEFCVGIVG